MDKTNLRFTINCCLLFSILLLSGCAKISNTPKEAYKVAVIAPQIGPYEALGHSIVNGAELAVSFKNKQGGIDGQKIKLIKVDDGGLAGEGTWRAKNLVDEMVLGVIGHLNSDISIPASEIYSKAMIVEISPASTSPRFTEREPVRGYVFRTIGRDDQQGEVAARHAVENKFKRIAIVYNNEIYGLSLASEFSKQINNLSDDARIVFYKMHRVGTDDLVKQVPSIKEKSPDLIFFVGEYSDAPNFLRALRKANANAVVLGGEGLYDPDLISNAKEYSEGVRVVALPEVKDQSFVKIYKESFGKDLGVYSANSFDAANILISAIEKVKENNSEKIAKAVAQTKDYPGLTGPISFDLHGDLVAPKFSIYQVKDGMFVLIE